ncbi:MAG: hypothetical protein M1827_003815 [Pycnora praestabilis]|nr:MAG: hypothetical protein M1827_003815 [Pycnora praestabilis]
MSDKKARPVDFDDLFEGIPDDNDSAAAPQSSSGGKPLRSNAQSTHQPEQDPLAGFDDLLAPRPVSRPQTPRLASSTAPGPPKSPNRRSMGTPSTGSTRSSEDKLAAQNPPRKSAESTRSFHSSFTPVEQVSLVEQEVEPETRSSAEQLPQTQQSGGWWGGIFATASAAVKQAEAAVKEIQKNEEAQRWAEQVKGNVGALRGLGGEIRSRALPTFTNILHTLAPPISSHERLQIHITHDFVGYPSLDPLIYHTFFRIMAQVEGGDLMVIQRGHESSPRRSSDVGFTGSSSTGWSDGPWWRQSTERRNLGLVKGIVEGTKLSKVSAESYASDYFASRGGVEEAAKHATEILSESNPVRSSDIFLAIQAISHTVQADLFGESDPKEEHQGVEQPKEKPDEMVGFAIYLHDPIHSITFKTVTQWIPQKWIDWLDAPSAEGTSDGTGNYMDSGLPEEIAEIINTGGVDPREWVAEWVEEVLALGVGVVAQRYVARRMGVGEGGIGRGKAREHTIESGAGEAARAL